MGGYAHKVENMQLREDLARLRAENARLREALGKIAEMDIGGPHIDARAGFNASLAGFTTARAIARHILEGQKGD